ncbi:Ig-like domain-containing protein [Mycolicibacterium madagascariense]|uniref:Ig-like domain-containing protein n=1 Tax=Mycolicibacterium madagascariense TaxID=212765 RepID=UPI0013D51089|nr:Ig-like domain-containing protein [Mycolicibacterium madagascariense]MCV7015103.1 hypothetical protein [Mycolicibacterium madagascariense]
MTPFTAIVTVVLSIFGLNAGNLASSPSAPIAPPNPLGDLVIAVFRRIQSVFTPYASTSGQQSVDSVTGVVTGTVPLTSPLFLPQTYTVTTAPTLGTVTINGNGTYTYTPSAAARTGAVTTDAFTVTAANFFSAASTTVSVPISRTNQAPVAGPTPISNPGENGVVLGQVSATDPNGDPITYTTQATSTLGGTVVPLNSTGGFIYTPTAQARHDAAAADAPVSALSDSFTITASDGRGGVTPIVVTVPVSPANSAPAAGTTTVNPAGANGVVTGTVSATDADADKLTYTGPTTTTTNGGTVTTTATGGFTYTPSTTAQHAAAGTGPTSDTFTVTVTDGHGGVTPVSVSVPITPTNTAPTGSVTVNAPSTGGVVTGTITGTDAEGDTVTYTGPTGTTTNGGTVTTTATGGFTYTPSPTAQHAAAGGGPTTDTFTVSLTDGHGGTTPVSVSVPITPTNTAPTATATVGAPSSSGVVSGTITATDADGDTLTYTGPTGTTTNGGTVVVTSTGAFTYTPTAAARAAAGTGGPTTDTFAVTVTDGHGGTTTVNVAATINPATVRLPYVQPGNTDIFLQADGTSIVYSTPVGATGGTTTLGGTVTVDENGDLVYTPSAQARANADNGGPQVDVYQSVIVDAAGNPTGFTEVAFPIVPASLPSPVAEIQTNVTDNPGRPLQLNLGFYDGTYRGFRPGPLDGNQLFFATALGAYLDSGTGFTVPGVIYDYRIDETEDIGYIGEQAVAGGPLTDTAVFSIYRDDHGYYGDTYTYVTSVGVGIPVPLPDGVTIYRDIPITTTPPTVV